MEKILPSRVWYTEKIGGMAYTRVKSVYGFWDFGKERITWGENSTMLKLYGMWCIFPLRYPQIQLGNSKSLKKCLMFGNYLWVPVLGKSQDHETVGKEDRHKEPLRLRPMLCHFCTNFTKKPLWDWVVALCQKEAFVAPQQGHSLRAKCQFVAAPTCPHGCTPFCCAQPEQPNGQPSMVR